MLHRCISKGPIYILKMRNLFLLFKIKLSILEMTKKDTIRDPTMTSDSCKIGTSETIQHIISSLFGFSNKL
jgi:hypothetical protein